MVNYSRACEIIWHTVKLFRVAGKTLLLKFTYWGVSDSIWQHTNQVMFHWLCISNQYRSSLYVCHYQATPKHSNWKLKSIPFRSDTSRRQPRWLPPCPLVIALVPLKRSSSNLQFHHRVPCIPYKMPWCLCPFKKKHAWLSKTNLVEDKFSPYIYIHVWLNNAVLPCATAA